MITFRFGEKEVFVYDAKDLAIQAADANADFHCTARIEFCSLKQLSHFKEMIEFIEEKHRGEQSDNR